MYISFSEVISFTPDILTVIIICHVQAPVRVTGTPPR